MKGLVLDALRRYAPAAWYKLPTALRRRIVWITCPKYTVGVSAILLNERNELLFFRHRYRERRGWELPGGLIKRGERLDTAIQREVKEETGFDVELISLIGVGIGPPLHVDVCFLARVSHGDLRVQQGEVVEARFFARDELPVVLREDQIRQIDAAIASA